MEEGNSARAFKPQNEDEAKAFKELQLITSKPMFYVCNVAEDEAIEGNSYSKKVQEIAEKENSNSVLISAKIEEEVAQLENEEEKQEFLQAIGLQETGLSKMIKAGYDLLDLQTFFTIGSKEARAWTIRKKSSAPQAAGKIHTDFEKGYIRAETIAFSDYLEVGSEQAAKDKGKMRSEGKDYVVQDGDVIHFRFNV